MNDTGFSQWVLLESELPKGDEGSALGVISRKAGVKADHGLVRRQGAGRHWRQRDIDERKLSLVAANTRNTVIIKDADNRIEWVNESFKRNYGYSLEECRGKYENLLIGDVSTRTAGADPASRLAAGTHQRTAVLRYGKDGKKRWIALESRPIVDEDGKITGFIEIENDITDSKLAEEKLQQAKLAAEAANLAKSSFLASMCHELRNPVSVMIGMMELALQTDLTAEQREYLSLMKISSNSLLSLVNNTLDLAKIEAGCLDAESIPFSLREGLGDTVRMLVFEARKKGLELCCEIAPEIPDSLQGDPMRLRQIVINLLCNAIKFTERGTVVLRVECERIDDGEVSCRFAIVDSGIGIAKDKQASIFEPFLQAETSTSRRYGGSGLGLTISAQLVKMMKGRIWLESEPGKGSTFFFTASFQQQEKAVAGSRVSDCAEFPGRQPAASVSCATAINYTLAESAALALDAVKPRARLVILLVDDNPLSRRMAQLVLEKEGHRVFPADGGAAALEMLECERIDLVLMDLQMPGMDGIRTTQAIRHREKSSGRHIPIVALTADPLPGAREYCLPAGMDGYLIKPLQPALLRETIEGLKVVAAGQGPVERDYSVVLDRRALLEQVDGDMQLLGEIIDLFLHHCDKLMACAQKTMLARDTTGFAHVLHTMLGMFRSLSALAAQETAERLQRLSIEADSDHAVTLYGKLEKDVKALKTELVSLSRESCTGEPEATQFLPETTRRNSRASLLSPAIKNRPWHRVSRLRCVA